MKTKIFTGLLFVLIFLSLINSVVAQTEVINLNNLKFVAVPVHILELALALFICYMSLKFFRITKPVNLFLFIYIAIGFFIINTLLYFLLYISTVTTLEMHFIPVYVGSRVALIGMMMSFVMFFYQWNRSMRKIQKVETNPK